MLKKSGGSQERRQFGRKRGQKRAKSRAGKFKIGFIKLKLQLNSPYFPYIFSTIAEYTLKSFTEAPNTLNKGVQALFLPRNSSQIWPESYDPAALRFPPLRLGWHGMAWRWSGRSTLRADRAGAATEHQRRNRTGKRRGISTKGKARKAAARLKSRPGRAGRGPIWAGDAEEEALDGRTAPTAGEQMKRNEESRGMQRRGCWGGQGAF